MRELITDIECCGIIAAERNTAQSTIVHCDFVSLLFRYTSFRIAYGHRLVTRSTHVISREGCIIGHHFRRIVVVYSCYSSCFSERELISYKERGGIFAAKHYIGQCLVYRFTVNLDGALATSITSEYIATRIIP